MKTHLKYLLLILLFSAVRVNAQSIHSCCSKPSTAEFAMLGKDESFKASHLSPLPFHYVAHGGGVVSIETADGKDARVFEVRSHAPTNNYLFVIHEWWGLNGYIKQEAEKLSHELGNVNVIALDLYDGKVAANPDEASKYMSESKEDRIKAIINGVIAYVGKDAKIQTIGWCFGGGWSLQTSLMAGKQAVGCVIYYGMPEKDKEKLKSLNAPVLGIFASKDNWITPEVVNTFEKDMKSSKKEIIIKFFDADHAFANPSNPKYDNAAAAEAHKLAVEFLKKHYN